MTIKEKSFIKDKIIAIPIAKWEQVNNNNYKRVFIYAFLYVPKGGDTVEGSKLKKR